MYAPGHYQKVWSHSSEDAGSSTGMRTEALLEDVFILSPWISLARAPGVYRPSYSPNELSSPSHSFDDDSSSFSSPNEQTDKRNKEESAGREDFFDEHRGLQQSRRVRRPTQNIESQLSQEAAARREKEKKRERRQQRKQTKEKRKGMEKAKSTSQLIDEFYLDSE